MKKGIIFLLATIFALSLFAEDFTINLYDSWGDGWNGNTIDVIVDGTTTNYTLASGSYQAVTIAVTDGVTITLDYLGGGNYNYEVSFTLLDAGGATLYYSGTDPAIGVHYTGTTKYDP